MLTVDIGNQLSFQALHCYLVCTSHCNMHRKMHFCLHVLILQGGNIIEDQDLQEIGIKDDKHRQQIIEAAKSLPKVKPISEFNFKILFHYISVVT